MSWNESHHPATIDNLPLEVRPKAIELANALLKQGAPEGKAIRIATATASHWSHLYAADFAPSQADQAFKTL
jgi:uncharacterized protein YdaT